MKVSLKLEEGISNWLLLTIVLSCASPAVVLNVWPRVDQIINNGITSNQIGIVLLVTLSALGMTCVPFAMKKAENLGFWLTCLGFGIGLGILNYTMAVGAVGKSRDQEAGEKSRLIERAKSLQSSISERERALALLPPFRRTSVEMVLSAQQGIKLAIEARDQECVKVGDLCRARVAQLANRQSELAEISASRATTQRSEQLESSLSNLRLTLNALGPIPESTDQQASRIAALLGTFASVGPNAAERVATGLIHFLAICAEAFALGMPRIIVTALARHPNAQLPKNPNPAPRPNLQVKGETIPLTIPPLQKPKAVGKNEVPVIDWKQSFLIRATGKIRSWEAYEHYKGEAKAKGLKPTSFLSFEQELQRLGVAKETDTLLRRDFFLEVAIRQPLKVVS